MKPFYFLLLPFVWILSYKASCQNTWVQQNPKPGSFSYYYLHMVNSQQGVCLAGMNVVAVTLNGGNYWSYVKVHSDSTKYPGELVFSSPLVGYLAVPDLSIFKTTDGGITWTNTGAGAEIQTLYFETDLIGYGLSNSNTTAPVKGFKTTNGGQSWVQTSTQSNGQFYSNLKARIPGEIWGVRNPRSPGFSPDRLHPYTSVNGGQTWTPVPITTPKQVNEIEWFDAQHGWMALDSSVVGRTIDAGQTWVYDTIGQGAWPVYVREFEFPTDPDHGFLVTADGQIFSTSDGGVNWNQLSNPTPEALTSIEFINNNEGWGAGTNGLLAHTTDGSTTWQKQTKGRIDYIRSGCLQNDTRAWVVGEGNLCMYTDDKGQTWNEVKIDTVSSSWRNSDIVFVKPGIGFVAGTGGIYKSTNGGVSWTKKTTGDQLSFNMIQFVHPDTGWAVNEWGKMIRTYDGGETWNTISEEVQFPQFRINNRIQFLNSQIGFWMHSYPSNYGGACYVWKTTDGGNTWGSINQTLSFVNGVYMYFLDENNGYVSQNNVLMHTVDGGASWQFINFVPMFTKIRFITPLIGYGVGYSFMKTEDAGLTWTEIPTTKPNYVWLSTLMFQGINPILIAGQGGAIFTATNWAGVNSYVASGRLVRNQNNDCIQDSFEPSLANRIVSAEPGQYYASTGEDGRFNLRLETGNYTIQQVHSSPVLAQLETQYCPPSNSSVNITVNGLLDTIRNNNLINNVKLCPVLVLSQNHLNMRPCRRSNLIITVRNQGNIASDSEWLFVKFPQQLSFIGSNSLSDFNALDSTYRFKVKPLAPNQSMVIEIQDSVACDPAGLTGQILCVKATIPNVPTCLLQSPNWDGADLEVASRCQNGQTKFTLHNKGAAMSSTSQYQIFIDSALVFEAPFQLTANSSMTVSLPMNAPSGFVRLVVPQSVNHPLSTFASAEANCATGQSTNGMFPPPDESSLVDIECVTVTNAFDPNDKQVFPTGWGTAGNVESGTEFKYTVRFQNTGSDTAFKVVLIDTLDEDLDIASLQVGNASHPHQFRVSGKGRPVLSWTFDNILLPDSNTNQLASNGFVSYSVRPKEGLSLGTRFENFADIYFDFNDPVRTNTTVNTLWQPTYTPGVLDTVFVTATKKPLAERDFSIFPNPSKGRLEVNAPESGRIQLYNPKGEMVFSLPVSSGMNVLDLSQFPKGLYLARIQMRDGQVSKKVILE